MNMIEDILAAIGMVVCMVLLLLILPHMIAALL